MNRAVLISIQPKWVSLISRGEKTTTIVVLCGRNRRNRMRENLTIYEANEHQLWKFEKINELTDEEWERRCVRCNDCSICDMAIHQQLFTTTRHICTFGMSEKKFRAYMTSADCYY